MINSITASHKDRITIGIPAYNEARYIKRTLTSAVCQSNSIIISDNASDDETYMHCEIFAKANPNIQLFKQPTNLGAAQNFRLLLDECRTEFFMWLGAHDFIPTNYTKTLIERLDANPDAVMSYGNSVHIGIDNHLIRTETYPLLKHLLTDNNLKERMIGVIRYLSECSLIHGVWRTNALRQAWVEGAYLGIDHVLLLKAAAIGQLSHTDDTHFFRFNPRHSDTRSDQLERIAGIRNLKEANYSKMYYNQIHISINMLGFKFLPLAIYSILSRFGAFNPSSYLRIIGINLKP